MYNESPDSPQITHVDLVNNRPLHFLRQHGGRGSSSGVFKDLKDGSRVISPFCFVRVCSPSEISMGVI
jgi:hypothetical protein